jgi:hypothetical protein
MVDVRDDGKVPYVPLIHEDTNGKLYHSHFFHLGSGTCLQCAMRFILAAGLLAMTSAPLAMQARPGVEQLAWMAGCWREEAGGRVADEIWMAPAGGVMLGMNRTAAGGRTVSTEFMQIREDAGRIVFIAKPSGQPDAAFALLKSAAREVVFENREHDFPQRVIYRLAGETLIGRIEGTQNGKPRSIDYPMRRVSCPS